jgi:YidC/Oxa1 family membrane protein insertase
MLLTEWVNFKDAKTAANEPQAVRLTSSNGINTTPELESAPVDNDELPEAPIEASDTAEATTPVVQTSDSVVRVYSEELQFAIDLRGGDIVELALPKFLEELDKPDVPFVLLEQNQQRVYVAQVGLIGKDGIDKNGADRPRYQSAQSEYRLAPDQDQLQIDLRWTNGAGVDITKRFTVHRGSYLIDVEFLVTNNTSSRWQGNLFGQIKRDSTPAPQTDSGAMGLQPFLGTATTQPDERFTKFSFEDMAEEPFKAQLPGGWIAMIQHYFLSAWIPNSEQSHTYTTRVSKSGFNIAGFTSPALAVDPGQTGTTGAAFYAGPKDQYALEKISPYLNLSVDYGWLWWIAQPLFWLLIKIQSLVSNWGVAIILLTVLIKAAFFKLSATSYRSMANMRRVQPKMQAIREEYAEDKQKQSQAMMDLYRKEKINPMGGCLPILVQMPVFIALYWVLMESVELRHAPFMLWIEDLSVKDPLFILPVIMGASMWFMQKLNPPPPDPMQAKIMQWMPVMFTFFFLWFPAGLVLYWVVNNLLSMAQQYVITKQIENAAA